MSKSSKPIPALLTLATAVLVMAVNAAAQDFDATIRIDVNVRVEGRVTARTAFNSSKSWAFARLRNGAGDRISELELKDFNGQTTAIRKLMEGEYLAEEEVDQWSYAVDLTPTEQFSDAAHFSWIRGERGILMLGDLLPQLNLETGKPLRAKIRFEIPDGWDIFSVEERTGINEFAVSDVGRAVFGVGRGWRENRVSTLGYPISILTEGDWRFSEDDAADFAHEIIDHYRKIFGGVPGAGAQIFLVRAAAEAGRWAAETRGATLTIVSGDMPFRKPSEQRLHEQLRHELLHLWVPNDLALTGNYDWFYEGFAVYLALRAGLELNRISFDDFLLTLAEADMLTRGQNQHFSMTDSARHNSGGSDPRVYARGMIVAFMADAAIMQKSIGRRSIESLFRDLYQRHRRPNQSQEAEAAILSLLRGTAELIPITENFIEGKERVDLVPSLNVFGIAETDSGRSVRYHVKAKLTKRQKLLLDKLGYNNWRKTGK